MKKILILLAVIALAIAIIFVIASRDEVEYTHTHKISHIDAVAPTCEKGGNKAHWKCSDCHKLFFDAEGKDPTSTSHVNLPIKHNYVNDVCSLCDANLFEFTLNSDNSSYTLTNIDANYTGNLIIPATYNGLPVTQIGNDDYWTIVYFNPDIDSITIPETVTVLSSSVLSANFSQINVDENNPKYKSIDGNLYTKDGKTLLLYASKKRDTHFTIPDGVENIGVPLLGGGIIPLNVIDYSRTLMSITIPESVKSYDYISSFGNLIEIINHSDLVEPTSALLTHSGDESRIVNKDGFLFVTANDDINYLVKYIGNDTEITLPESYNGENYIIYDYAFAQLSKLTSITIPDTVDEIRSGVFNECTSLSKISIGKSVNRIANLTPDNVDVSFTGTQTTFEDCISLSEINVSPENETFKSVDGNLYMKDGKTLIRYAVGKIEKSFAVPDTVEKIAEVAFYSAYSLENVSFPSSLKTISSSAFADCIGLTEINIPDTVTDIEYGAFSGCESINSLTLNQETIGACAFSYCKNLKTVVIGSNVKHIEMYSFYMCDKLESVTFESTEGWFIDYYGSDNTPIDVSDPKQNAKNLLSEYLDVSLSKE